MTRDEITRMAREAGFIRVMQVYEDGSEIVTIAPIEELTRFAALVAAAEREHGMKLLTDVLIDAAVKAEREACAKVCEDMSGPIEIFNPKHVHYIDCAAAIRARGGKHDRKGN